MIRDEGAPGEEGGASSFLSPRVAANVALKLVSEVGGKALALALTVALARGLGQSGFGVYVFGFSAGLALAQVCDFGMQIYAAREVARGRPDAPRLAGNLFLVRGALGLLGLCGLVPVAWWAGADPSERVAIWALGAGVLVTSGGEFIFYLFRGRQEVGHEARMSLVQRGLSLTAAFVAIHLGWGLTGVAWGLFAASAISFLLAYRILARHFFRLDFSPDPVLIRASLREVLPIGLAIALSAVSFRSDVMILKAVRGIQEVGLYGAGRRLMEPLALLPASLMAGVFPAFSALPEADPGRRRLLRRSLLLLIGLSVPLAILGAFAGGPLLRVVYGPAYAAAGPAFSLLTASLVPMFLTYGLTHFLIALGLARLNALFFGVGLVVSVAGNLCLAPSLGATGSALSLLITEGVLMVLCGSAVMKVLK